MSDRREDGNSFNFEYDYSKTDEENTATLNMLLRDLSVEPVQKSSQEADGAMDALKKLEPEELEQHAEDLPELHEILSAHQRSDRTAARQDTGGMKPASCAGAAESSGLNAAAEPGVSEDEQQETRSAEQPEQNMKLEDAMEENEKRALEEDTLKGDKVELIHVEEDQELTPKEEKAVTGAAVGLLIGIIGAAAVLTFGALLSDHRRK